MITETKTVYVEVNGEEYELVIEENASPQDVKDTAKG